MNTSKRTLETLSMAQQPLKKQRKVVSKQAFDSPFHIRPHLIPENEQRIVLEYLIDKLRLEMHSLNQSIKNVSEEHKVHSDNRSSRCKRRVKLPTKKLCFGINEVSRSLEHDKLALVVVFKDVQPSLLIQHFPTLCQLKKVPLCIFTLPDARLKVKKIFFLKSLICFGLKKESIDDWQTTIEFIRSKIS